MSEGVSASWNSSNVKNEAITAPVPCGDRLSFAFVCLFIIAIYARPEDMFAFVGRLHLTMVLGLCASVSFLWSLFAGQVVLSWPRELRLVLLMTLWFAVGVPFAYWRGGSFELLTQTWARTLLVFFLLTQTLVTLKRIRVLLWAVILSELVVTVVSLAAPRSETWRACLNCGIGDRMSGINQGILYWNVFGIAIGITIPYMAALFISKRSMVRSLLLLLTIGAASWMLVLTASRSGTLDVALAVILTLLLLSRGTSRGNVIGIGIVIALLATILMAPSVFWSRMSTLSGDQSTNAAEVSAVTSENERSDLLSRSIQETLEHPLFGLGLGNFGVYGGTYLAGPEAWLASHNTFTEISSETGIPGLLLFIALLAIVLVNMRDTSRAMADNPASEVNLLARATIASTITLIFGCLFANISYEYYLYVCPVAIAVGIYQVAARQRLLKSKTPDGLAGERRLPAWSL